jgi:hypothetical protein
MSTPPSSSLRRIYFNTSFAFLKEVEEEEEAAACFPTPLSLFILLLQYSSRIHPPPTLSYYCSLLYDLGIFMLVPASERPSSLMSPSCSSPVGLYSHAALGHQSALSPRASRLSLHAVKSFSASRREAQNRETANKGKNLPV